MASIWEVDRTIGEGAECVFCRILPTRGNGPPGGARARPGVQVAGAFSASAGKALLFRLFALIPVGLTVGRSDHFKAELVHSSVHRTLQCESILHLHLIWYRGLVYVLFFQRIFILHPYYSIFIIIIIIVIADLKQERADEAEQVLPNRTGLVQTRRPSRHVGVIVGRVGYPRWKLLWATVATKLQRT